MFTVNLYVLTILKQAQGCNDRHIHTLTQQLVLFNTLQDVIYVGLSYLYASLGVITVNLYLNMYILAILTKAQGLYRHIQLVFFNTPQDVIYVYYICYRPSQAVINSGSKYTTHTHIVNKTVN